MSEEMEGWQTASGGNAPSNSSKWNILTEDLPELIHTAIDIITTFLEDEKVVRLREDIAHKSAFARDKLPEIAESTFHQMDKYTRSSGSVLASGVNAHSNHLYS